MQVRHVCSTLGLALLLTLGGLAVANDMAPEPTVNINQADAQTLAEVLHGVGLARAEAIVRYRESNGGFMTAEELANVSGIGLATVDRNQGRIRLRDED
ncbi:MAG: helix-hairpin-helix domain-containing protein [Gammaproteobacteria bacterium]|nr:helix-hairpin-helix domain-containing protein [Gammaproteobacteria bacterium]